MKPELINVVRILKDYGTKQSEYLDTIPSDINQVFFDNTYVNLLQQQNDLLIDHLFGEFTEDVSWFLYEFEAGKSPGPHCRLADGTEYTYNTNEDYYEYLKELYENTKTNP
jgi:hypothetical protein